MQLKKFVAKDMRSALTQVREALGDDAAILSTRSVAGGVEVVATQSPPAPDEAAAQAAAEDAVSKAEFGAMRSELNSIRSLLQQRLNGLAWDHFARQTPAQAAIWERLSTMGLPGSVNRRLLEKAGQEARTLEQLWRQVLSALSKMLPVVGADLVERGGVFALLGPTGAGKTTTIAKLATRYVLRHGADDVALVTTDSFRLAAHEQLRTLGRILGVSVRIVDNQHSLADTLESLSHKKLVLIDTAGLPSRHPEQMRQLTELQAQPQIHKWLVLPSTTQAQVLNATWKSCSTASVSACILTHLDEACVMGEALGLCIERQLPVVYETFGQSIPDDLALASGQSLVKRAVALGRAQASIPVDRNRIVNEYGSQTAGNTALANQALM
jgi:flagellar biosynthesis protein FlhF